MIVSWPTLHLFRSLALFFLLSSAQEIASLSTKDSIPSTCPFRTVNYITHSLPQQCLATTNLALMSQHEEQGLTSVEGFTTVVSEEQQTRPAEQQPSATLTATLHDASTRDHLPNLAPSTKDNELAPKLEKTEVAEFAGITEEESELESDKFLSFEEWKKQNLKKAGQSEHIARRNQETSQEPRKRPANVHSSLESLGDDGEIDIDFSGFVPGGPQSAREVSQPIADHASDADEIAPSGSPRVRGRSKDAGTTCKERFNHASFDCAANVLKTNKEAKSPHTVLMENKDSYMLNRCTASNKFLILELCNDVSIDTVVLANFEFFSSTFRTFRISVSDHYPVEMEKWKSLGTYEARNTREIQAFLIESPLIYAKYVRIEFLTHYGNEFYCPVSLVRIHGKTMFEDWKNVPMEDDNEDSDRGASYDDIPIGSFSPEAGAETLQTDVSQSAEIVIDSFSGTTDSETSSLSLSGVTEPQGASSTVPASVVAFEAIMSVIESSDTCIAADSSPTMSSSTDPSPASSADILDTSTTTVAPGLKSLPSDLGVRSVSSIQSVNISAHSAATMKGSTDSLSQGPTTRPVSHSSGDKSSIVLDSAGTESIKNSLSHKEKPLSSMSDKSKPSGTTPHPQKEKPSASASERNKPGGSPSQAQPATPTMQESFFKSVQKRLQMLEANSSLSLQYIEDQSRALRDAFKKVEQRQLTKTTAFLDQLNQTVLNELRDFRQQYDQLWQSTVIELELQRERYERDNEAINARLGILADEVIFQRRMAILQMFLILVCLVLVLFSRGVINNYLELPLVQNVLAKSPSSKWLNLSGVESGARPPQPARTRSAHQLRNGILKGHRRMQSEDSITDTQSGTEVYAPPTPISDYGHSEAELSRDEPKSPIFESDKDDGKFGDPEFDPNTIERPSTSPPVLRVNGVSPISDILETSEEDATEARPSVKSNSIPNNESSLKVTTEFVPMGKRLSWDLPNS